MTFSKNVVPKESFSVEQTLSLFSTVKLANLLEIITFGRDCSNLRHVEKIVMILQVRALKIVTNGQQHTITNEDEEIYF